MTSDRPRIAFLSLASLDEWSVAQTESKLHISYHMSDQKIPAVNPLEEAMLDPLESITYSDDFSISEVFMLTSPNNSEMNASSEKLHEVNRKILEQSVNSACVDQRSFSPQNYSKDEDPDTEDIKIRLPPLSKLSQKQHLHNFMTSDSHNNETLDTSSLQHQMTLSGDDILRDVLMETIDSIKSISLTEDIDKIGLFDTNLDLFIASIMHSKDSLEVWEALELIDQNQEERVTQCEPLNFQREPSTHGKERGKNKAARAKQSATDIRAFDIAADGLQDISEVERPINTIHSTLLSTVEKVARNKATLNTSKPKSCIIANCDSNVPFQTTGLAPSDIQKSVLALAEKVKSENEERKCSKRKLVKEPSFKMYFEKRDVDVLFGRGSGPNTHNKSFREYVAQYKDSYLNGSAETKNEIVQHLIDWVNSREGRFLNKDDHGWYEVSEKAVRIKVRQLVREMNVNAG
jgi:hypothetical protein